MTEWGRRRFVTPGLVFKGELITTDLVEINLAIRILLGSSYFDDWTNEETFVTHDPLGNPVDKRHPWNKVTLPCRRRATGPTSTAGSPRRGCSTSATTSTSPTTPAAARSRASG